MNNMEDIFLAKFGDECATGKTVEEAYNNVIEKIFEAGSYWPMFREINFYRCEEINVAIKILINE
jgi:hypothetical protein